MAQIVRREVGEIAAFHKPFDASCNCIGVARLVQTVFRGENERAAQMGVWVFAACLLFEILQQLQGAGHDGDSSHAVGCFGGTDDCTAFGGVGHISANGNGACFLVKVAPFYVL